FLRCRLPDAERMSLQDQLDTMKTRRTQLAARLQDRRQRLQTAQEQALTQQTLDAIETAIASRRQQLSVLQEAAAGLTHRLQQHDLARQELRKQQEALNLQQQVVDRWDALHQLVGSADGKKYRNFAQGLTFEWMVGHANTQLQTMTDRYVLVHDAFRPLELGVIDNYQAGERRSTRNLSGGESFIVSLAL